MYNVLKMYMCQVRYWIFSVNYHISLWSRLCYCFHLIEATRLVKRELEFEPCLPDSRAKLLCCWKWRQDITHTSTFCTWMEKGIVRTCTDYLHIRHQEKGPRVADGSRASLVRQKTKRNRNSGSSLPNTPHVPSPVEPYCWGPSPVLNPGRETLLSLASHPSSQIRRLRSRHSGPAFNHYSCHCLRMPNSSASYSHCLFLLLRYKVAKLRLTRCVSENKQLSFI